MSLHAFHLSGKNALITGSHKGLGAAIAISLAQAAANVGCHGRDPKPGNACDEIRALGRKTFYFAGDVANAAVGFEIRQESENSSLNSACFV